MVYAINFYELLSDMVGFYRIFLTQISEKEEDYSLFQYQEKVRNILESCGVGWSTDLSSIVLEFSGSYEYGLAMYDDSMMSMTVTTDMELCFDGTFRIGTFPSFAEWQTLYMQTCVYHGFKNEK